MKEGNRKKPVIVGIIGGTSAGKEILSLAEELGKRIAEHGHVLMTGGGPGVMEAASRGAFQAGGLVIGILPTNKNRPLEGYPNEYVNIPIYTGLSDGRNVIISKSPDVIIALDGGLGTISEIALALKNLTPVIAVSCSGFSVFHAYERFMIASSVQEAMELIIRVVEDDFRLQ